MLENINNFFNDKPILGVILILLLLWVVYYIYSGNFVFEHMDPVILPKCTINDDQQFNSQYVVQSKILNFKCTIGGIDYYLACVKMSDYTVQPPQDTDNPRPDCTQSMLILIPTSEITTMLTQYVSDLNVAERICNSTLKIRCEADNQSDKSSCQDTYPSCKQPRMFIHDFTILDITPEHSDSMTLRKYIVKGTALPTLNGQSSPTMINTFLLGDNGINIVCGDVISYGSPNVPKQYAEIVISEKSTSGNGGIINNNSTLKVKFRFNALQQLMSDLNGVKKRTPIVDQCTGEQKTKPVYLGICDQNRTCTKGSNVYPRVCVYDDILNPNVLEFEPYIANI